MSKIKLVPVPNIKTHEVLTRMMENGETFKYIKPQPEGVNAPSIVHDLHYDRSHPVNPFRLGTKAWDFRGLKYLHEEIEQQWYENIPKEGILCWIWETGEDRVPGIISGYIDEDVFPYKCIDGTSNGNAIPVTAADLYQEQV